MVLKGTIPLDKYIVLYERTDQAKNVEIQCEIVTLEELMCLKFSVNVIVWFSAKGDKLQYAHRIDIE